MMIHYYIKTYILKELHLFVDCFIFREFTDAVDSKVSTTNGMNLSLLSSLLF